MKKKQLIQIMLDTIKLTRERCRGEFMEDIPELGFTHMLGMMTTIHSTDDMPEDKMERWLGWFQACAVYTTRGGVRMSYLQEINKKVFEANKEKVEETHVDK